MMEHNTLFSPTPYGRELPEGDLDDFIFAVSDEPTLSDR